MTDRPNMKHGNEVTSSRDSLGGKFAQRDSLENPAGNSGVDAEAKSFSPADRRLSEQIIQVLRATGCLPLRDLRVFSADGLVTLQGRVPSYYMKQVAQSAICSLPGVVGCIPSAEVGQR
jgi:hypothetical protein